MADFLESVLEKLDAPKNVALPEATDARMLEAAERVTKEGWAKITFVGDEGEIAKAAAETGRDVANIPLVNPADSPDLDEYCQEYWRLRGKGKPYDDSRAKKFMLDPIFYAAMMARMGAVDGVVAGAITSTANVVRSGIYIVKCVEGVKTVSSYFLMEHPNRELGVDGKMIYADCAVMPNPDEDQLVDIAIASAGSARKMLGVEPIVAFLSFSTKGSANHPDVEKVRNAVAKTQERAPDLVCDGELQFDSAVVPSVGQRKCPDSPVAGKANTFIFPDLDAGNIGYKITQRLAGANAFGPFLQGLAKPINDLSRGCSAEDIVCSIAVTSLQAD